MFPGQPPSHPILVELLHRTRHLSPLKIMLSKLRLFSKQILVMIKLMKLLAALLKGMFSCADA